MSGIELILPIAFFVVGTMLGYTTRSQIELIAMTALFLLILIMLGNLLSAVTFTVGLLTSVQIMNKLRKTHQERKGEIIRL